MAAGDPTTPPPGPEASTNYQTGQMNAGYVWLYDAGWVWQDAQGHISAQDQNTFAQGAAAKERAAAQAGDVTSSLYYDPVSKTYIYRNTETDMGTSGMPSGWLTEKQIYDAAKAAGVEAQGYTSSYTYDSQGNPVTRVGITDKATGSTGILNGDGTIKWVEGPKADQGDQAGYVSGWEGKTAQYAKEQAANKTAASPWTDPNADPKLRNAWDQLTAMLSEYGLGDLNKFAWDAVTNGDSQERILQNLRDTPTYKQRFPAMADRAAKGLRAISEQEYMDYERSVRQLMAEAGLPGDMWDSSSDYRNFIGNDVSIRELTQRTNDLFEAANNAPAEVQQAFKDWFGVDGTHALATYFMDPTKALPILQQQLNEAQVGGTAKRFGIGVGLDKANEIARLGMQPGQYEQKFAQVAGLTPLFNETITENTDLNQNTGIDAVIFGNQDATKALQQRGEQRSAEFGGGGGAALSGSGALGLQQDR